MEYRFVFFLSALVVCTAATVCDSEPSFCQQADCRKEVHLKLCCRTCAGPNPPTGGPPIYTKGPKSCGNKPSPKVSGPGAWPWQVLIFYKNYRSCGGTIVGDRHVVTAAHCIPTLAQPDQLLVRVGDYDVDIRDEGYEVDHQVETIFIKGGFSGLTREKDIAVLKLKTSIQFNSHVQPICLPLDDVKANSECYSLGWRREMHAGHHHHHTVLKEAKLSSVDKGVCQKQFPKHIIFDTMVCAGNPSISTRTCHDHMGGGLVCKSGANWVLHGVLSYNHDDCKARNLYSIFTRVRSFGRWILELKSK